jgi:chloramphenicol 3-O phosphotransferase
MSKGNVIFLNGVSSSGKTVIAIELQRMLEQPYLHFSVDGFLDMLPSKYLSGEGMEDLPGVISRVVTGMHRCIAASASAGNNIIVDHVLQIRQWLQECVELLYGFPVLFVGVRCPLEELERREARRDREKGLARYQFDLVHSHGIYDVEVDTSKCGPEECARQIQDALRGIQSADAFRQLKKLFDDEDREGIV